MDRVLGGLAGVVTNASGVPGDLGVVERGAVAVRHGRIAWVGPEADLPGEHRELPVERFDGCTLVPGFVDSHTHAVFAGDRADEFALRTRGATYEEILAAGGGIHSTVAATRAAGEQVLAEETTVRLRRMLATGTTTVEVKSGYGLDLETERRQLEVARALGRTLPLDVVTTFLAHVPDRSMDRAAYLDLLTDEILPGCAAMAEFCDVFCDAGAFDLAETRRVLHRASALGLRLKLHAEQLSHTGAATLAGEVGAVSADHLDHVDDAGIAAMAAAGTTAVLLPGVSLTLGIAPPPGRRLFDAGLSVALATDCNPGSSYLTTMPLIVALGVLTAGLTVDEAVWAATAGGARALGLTDRGDVVAGHRADLVVVGAPSVAHLAYRPDSNLIEAVFVGGERISVEDVEIRGG